MIKMLILLALAALIVVVAAKIIESRMLREASYGGIPVQQLEQLAAQTQALVSRSIETKFAQNLKDIKILELGAFGANIIEASLAQKEEPQPEPESETVENPTVEPGDDVVLSLPSDLEGVEVFSQGDSRIYTQNQGEYTIAVEVLQADSPEIMLRELTGLNPERLTVMTTWQGDFPRYDLTWACAGESGLMVCRGVVLDDGCHFYAVTATMPETLTAEYTERVESCFAGLSLTENTDGTFTAP